jgi:hypothetical protein
MHSVLPEVEKVCSLLVEKKVLLYLLCLCNFFFYLSAIILFLLFMQLIHSKYDEVGVIIFGTEGIF